MRHTALPMGKKDKSRGQQTGRFTDRTFEVIVPADDKRAVLKVLQTAIDAFDA